MADRVHRRDLYVLVQQESAHAVLVTDDDALPRFELELFDEERTLVGALDAIRAMWNTSPTLLEIFFEPGIEDDTDNPVTTLVVLDALPADWLAPDGHRWLPFDASAPAAAAGLAERIAEWVGEWSTGREPPAFRPRWARHGWYERAAGWTTRRLAELGRPAIGAVEQIHQWELSAIMRVETSAGWVWFKAVFPTFAREPAITELVGRAFPGQVAPVLAIDIDEGWLLLDDIGSDAVDGHPDADGEALRLLVTMQRASVDRLPELRAVGCPARPFSSLADDVARTLADPEVLAWIAVTPERIGQLVEWIRDAAERVVELPFPDTLVHGDLHPRNVVLVDGHPLIFDWSDAAIAHPLVDVMTWIGWLRRDPARGELAWKTFVAAWSDVCTAERIESFRIDFLGLTAGYHAVSYAGIVIALEPIVRWDMAGGLRDYFDRLDEVVPQ